MTERRFQDWMVRCGRPRGQEAEVCEMQQQQIDNEDRTVMAVAVGQVPGTSDVGLLILLPLGILLPAGVTMQIDSGAEIPLEVERCERQGCRIERLIEPDLLSRLKGGHEGDRLLRGLRSPRQTPAPGRPDLAPGLHRRAERGHELT